MPNNALAYYNELDPVAAAWLRELIRRNLIAPGEVDERSIEQVQPSDLVGFTQCHFFAGVGVWSAGLRAIGWPDSRPVWTGSCPCPPFSSAGKKKPCPECGRSNPVPHVGRTGYFVCCDCGREWLADGRHLWPELWRLVAYRRPPVLFGEQVASLDGRIWLASVRSSLEILGYAVGGADTCAAGVGAPHIRQRLYFVADSRIGRALGDAQGGGRGIFGDAAFARSRGYVDRPILVGGRPGAMVNPDESRRERDGLPSLFGGGDNRGAIERATGPSPISGMADADGERREHRQAIGRGEGSGNQSGEFGNEFAVDGDARRLADSDRDGRDQTGRGQSATGNDGTLRDGRPRDMVDAVGEGLERLAGDGDVGDESGRIGTDAPRSTPEASPTRVMGNAAGIARPQEFAGVGVVVGERPADGGRSVVGPESGTTGGGGGGDVTAGVGGGGSGDAGTSGVSDVDDESESDSDDGSESLGGSGGLVYAGSLRREMALLVIGRGPEATGVGQANVDRGRGPLGGFWADAEWIPCLDGKARPVEPGSFPLAHGATARVGRLRGYGNAIVKQQAEAFVVAYIAAVTDLGGEP